jgi:tRNA (cmo5U34)-methyltransferase
VLSTQLLEQGAPVELTLVDGSSDMLTAARRRLNDRSNAVFIQKTFDELIGGHGLPGPFDLVLSGFAIHHLHRPQRRDLFNVILAALKPGGHFVNVETALAETADYSNWYFELWRQWIDVQGRRSGMQDKYHAVPDQARANPDNKYSPLQEQLSDLREAGFLNVDCHYRNGIFTVYGGTSPGNRLNSSPPRPVS